MPEKKKFKKKSRFEVGIENQNGSNSCRKAPSLKPNGSSKVKIATKGKKRTTVKIEAKFEIGVARVLLELPIRTVSEANCSEPWRAKHARHKEQQRVVALALNPHRSKVKLPCRVMLTRFAPHELDRFDNLPMSFKYIVDAVCAIITGNYRAGHADSDERISIACDQVVSKAYGIRIEVTW